MGGAGVGPDLFINILNILKHKVVTYVELFMPAMRETCARRGTRLTLGEYERRDALQPLASVAHARWLCHTPVEFASSCHACL